MKFNQELREGKLKFETEGFPAEVKGIGLRHVFKGPFKDQLTQILQSLPHVVEPADKQMTEKIIKEVSKSSLISNVNNELLRKTMILNLVGKTLIERLKYNFIHLAFDEVEQELFLDARGHGHIVHQLVVGHVHKDLRSLIDLRSESDLPTAHNFVGIDLQAPKPWY